ncbi:hypothetical protein [Geodermatophilus sp. DSM 44513]|uniref:hypothetical protein n=1 Tax=Geodermatophilus sp. DSM 44513 TaxID=1528104 RepID=UPI00128A5764|nr:hypothetical protein [Geodermatophilus sp. DSM 44513]WNV74062.1 hypothetical protein RTG05_13800 [Geodermatophilus sp. DSM 44513]
MAKLAGNTARDRRTDAVLRAHGWRVLRFWEHEDPDAVADAICAALGRPSFTRRSPVPTPCRATRVGSAAGTPIRHRGQEDDVSMWTPMEPNLGQEDDGIPAADPGAGAPPPADGFGVGGEEPDRPEELPEAATGGEPADDPPFRTPDPADVSRDGG